MRDEGLPAILFVCAGNICRSPLAEGVVRARARDAGLELRLDSAGTEDYHVGQAPDRRARAVATRFGCGIDDLRARQVEVSDFQRFDLILVADRRNLAYVQRLRPPDARAEVALFAEWSGQADCSEIPDPYYAGYDAFEAVYRLLERCADGLLRRLAKPS
jgi:protein-tyrosine phosphatase